MIRLLVSLAALAACPALAEESPSFDCAKAESGAEQLICADADLAALDRTLAGRYADALEAVRGLDAGSAEAEEELRARQNGWVGGRDDCWKAGDLRACVEDAYLRREGELVARWILEDPSATAFWLCDDGPEVALMYFDTPLPAVRFEIGDSIDTGTLSRTASGARYDGSFGRYIWMKGDEATYRSADPDGSEYSCTLQG